MKVLYRVAVLSALLALAGIAVAQAPVPPAPADVQAVFQPSGAYSHIQLAWVTPSGPWFFRIYRSVDDTMHFHTINVTNMLRYDDYMIMPGHTYNYYVKSFVYVDSTLVESGPSAVASVTIPRMMDRPKGEIAGTVTDSATGKPIPLVRVVFYRRPLNMPVLPQVWTDSLGQYRAVLDTGTYLIRAVPWLATNTLPQFAPEWYQDALFPSQATPVALAESASVSIDFSLRRVPAPPTAWLSGTVRDTLGNPLKYARVVVMHPVWELHAEEPEMFSSPLWGVEVEGLGYMRGVAWAGWTDSLGNYSAHLVAGRAYVVAAAKRFYLPEFFNNKTRPDEADIVHLVNDTTGIDFSLSLIPAVNNSISGMVRDSAGTGVMSHVMLIPKRAQATPLAVRFTSTDSTGAYSIASVRAGVYRVFAVPYTEYAPAFYKAGAFGVIHWKDADTIMVSGDVTGIDVGVVPVTGNGIATLNGAITTTSGSLGKITAAAGVPGGNVYVQNSQGGIVGYGMTDDQGNYTITNVPPGSFTLTVDKDGYSSYTAPLVVSPTGYDVTVPGITINPESVTSVESPDAAPTAFRLEQNYPNPFNPATIIGYTVGGAGDQGSGTRNVKLTIYNLLGQEVAVLVNGQQPAGRYSVHFDGSKLASGVYLYRLQAGSFVETKRMLLLK